jgi:hypothetical protein
MTDSLNTSGEEDEIGGSSAILRNRGGIEEGIDAFPAPDRRLGLVALSAVADFADEAGLVERPGAVPGRPGASDFSGQGSKKRGFGEDLSTVTHAASLSYRKIGIQMKVKLLEYGGDGEAPAARWRKVPRHDDGGCAVAFVEAPLIADFAARGRTAHTGRAGSGSGGVGRSRGGLVLFSCFWRL